MIKFGASSTTLEPDQEVSGQPKERIPIMAIPVTLAIGLLVAGVYVGARIFASGAHATPIIAAKPLPASDPVAKPTAFGPTPGTQVHAAPIVAATAAPVARASVTEAQVHAAAPAFASKVEASPASAEVRTGPEVASKQEVQTNISGQTVAQDKDLGLIEPKPGERYLQIAAISSNMVASFLADLKKYNVEARVAPGPHEGLVRIVIGPFANRDTVARAKDQIQANWPDCFVRLY
jgi:cell division septation protein DedD